VGAIHLRGDRSFAGTRIHGRQEERQEIQGCQARETTGRFFLGIVRSNAAMRVFGGLLNLLFGLTTVSSCFPILPDIQG
jgi:hypothetical protein